MHTEDLVTEALQLSPRERAHLVDALLLSLDQPDAAIDRAWAEEALRRLDAVRRGTMATLAADDVLRPRP